VKQLVLLELMRKWFFFATGQHLGKRHLEKIGNRSTGRCNASADTVKKLLSFRYNFVV
jgi:hypothetical protein